MVCCTHWPWRPVFVVIGIFSSCLVVATFSPPASRCYAIDKQEHLHDFTQWSGKVFNYSQKGTDFTLRFCKDIQMASSEGLVNYGRFLPNQLFLSSDEFDFSQEYAYGDLAGCEQHGFDQSGRSSKVSIFCGSCPDGSACRDPSGCICNVAFDSSKCRVLLEIGIQCGTLGPRVFTGFTVGFSPRGREVVNNGITQWGYEMPHADYSFVSEQSTVFLYFTARSAVANKVQMPSYQVYPNEGLNLKIFGSAANGDPPTTESPTVLGLEWQCDLSNRRLYSVKFEVLVKDYDSIVFTLGKLCDHQQKVEASSSSSWATFGVFSCIFIVMLTLCCCAGFCYRTRVEHKHGLEALPGIGVLSSCLDMITGSNNVYQPADYATSSVDHPSAVASSMSSRVSQRVNDSKYGAT